jgi:hypothetical protein
LDEILEVSQDEHASAEPVRVQKELDLYVFGNHPDLPACDLMGPSCPAIGA